MSADLQPLRDWLDAHPSVDEPIAEHRGGELRIDEKGKKSLTMPWLKYSATIPAFWEALDAAGWTVEDTCNYLPVVEEWETRHGASPTDPERFGQLDRHTLANALRWYNRGEHFCDGLWASAFKRGVMQVGARAVLALGGLSPPPGPPPPSNGTQGEFWGETA